MTKPSPHEGRRAHLFGRVYVWTSAGGRWQLRGETADEAADRIAGPVDPFATR